MPATTTNENDSLVSTLLDLARLARDVNGFFQSRGQSVDWHVGGDGPVFGICATDQTPHLRAICRYGANVADEWTAVTRDRSLSAQFEHTIGVTDDGCEIFTLSPGGLHKPPYTRG